MVELAAEMPCAGLLPIIAGEMRLEEVDPGQLTIVAPFRGRQSEVGAHLNDVYGLAYPGPNETAASDQGQAIWFGRDKALLFGVVPDPHLFELAAVTDQSDSWACVELSGEQAEDALARLVPVDLRPSVFGQGQTRLTLLGHMNASLTRQRDGSILILVFRSMAHTLVSELKEAMDAVVARQKSGA